MCVGPLKRLCHWGPLMAVGIVKLISFMMVHCSNMMLPPYESFSGFLNLSLFLMFSGMTLYNFLSAMCEGPGYLPLKWVPEHASDEPYLQFCTICQGYKAPRSHHCKKCKRCVLKMDHHCPWINNCVGHANHAHFTSFLFCSVCGCIQSTIILSMALYRAFNKEWYIYHGFKNYVRFNLYTLLLCLFAVGLSVGVVLAVGMLFFLQMRAIVRNRTAIEDWILEKALSRKPPTQPKFIYPYNLGWKANIYQVFNLNCEPLGDGITWPVVEGCNQYTLTIEQKEQKEEKRARTRPYMAIKKFSGCWFPVVHGLKVFCSPPFTDEPRISLQPNDTLSVTRWRRHWLFGEKTSAKDGKKTRGWFPRSCVIEVTTPNGLEFEEKPEELKKKE